MAEAVATPWVGEESTPTSVTESPSGSMPLRVTGIVTAWPALVHALRVLGRGASLLSVSGMTSKVTVLEARLPAESMTE